MRQPPSVSGSIRLHTDHADFLYWRVSGLLRSIGRRSVVHLLAEAYLLGAADALDVAPPPKGEGQ